MKNISYIDNYNVMVGSKWVANAFCFNYGYENHNFENSYLLEEYEHGHTMVTNTMGISRREMVDKIKRYMHPSNFDFNLSLGESKDMIYGSNVKQYNSILIYFSNKEMFVYSCWLDYDRNNPRFDFRIEEDDLNLVDYRELDNFVVDSKLIVIDNTHFKYTVEMYKYDLYLRFGLGFYDDDKLFVGDIRIDSGEEVDEDTGEITFPFSGISSYKVPDEIAHGIIYSLDKKILKDGV